MKNRLLATLLLLFAHCAIAADAGNETAPGDFAFVAEAKMKAAGIQQIDPNKAFIDAILAKRRELEAAWFKQAARKGVDGPMVLQAFRAEVKKVLAGR